MFDDALRRRVNPVLDRIVAPVVRLGIGPDLLTTAGLLMGLGAALTLALGGSTLLAGALFLLNRVVDGLDGALARRTIVRRPRGGGPGWGGIWDMTADATVYVAIPLGLAAGRPDLWPAAAVLCAAIAVNLVTVLAPAQRPGGERSVALSPGLIEGTETIVAYAVLIVVPVMAPVGLWVVAAAVVLTAADRLRRLRPGREPSAGPGAAPPP